jgi:hypothetical protein
MHDKKNQTAPGSFGRQIFYTVLVLDSQFSLTINPRFHIPHTLPQSAFLSIWLFFSVAAWQPEV